ncbi:thiol oxidoreductase [Parasulfuritortus cantonensis]|uniref:Thiol oxidoreductase n=1 Tax=Parasulfuritortus cantonensis TaxID=2528202 RepID=A0A4R1B620_9PROT|nr:di-heme oxidoredictase family protein [Parasulfuritortus cantonensis]TCJ11658.1 thiol oxidoreductase [Parasulfuritortus cantonensis]
MSPRLRRLGLALAACGLFSGAAADTEVSVADAGRDAYSQPFPGLTEAERDHFFRGRSLFRQSWVVSPAKDTEVDGLGPLYNRLACISCHARNGRGFAPDRPGERMQTMLLRLSVPGIGAHGGPLPHPAYGDQFNEEGIPGVPGEGRAETAWTETEVVLPGGETVMLRQPAFTFSELAYGPIEPVLVSARIGQPVFGMGLLDAVSAEELERMAAEAKPDGVGGRVNRVWDAAAGRAMAGRLGYKANMPNLRQQIAGAMLGDLGITSPLFGAQNCTPAQAACRQAPDGGHPELTGAQLDDMEFYLAHLAAPERRRVDDPRVRQGERLFAAIGCTACHRPLVVTGEHPKFPRLAHRAIAPYSDLLLHDMGEGLADRRPDYLANGREWRTAPLWGIGLAELIGERVGYLHDGRARSLLEAVLWHGGEAAPAQARFSTLPAPERSALLAFLASL